jgi:MFS family permease
LGPLRPRIFYGWYILILGSLINGVGMGILYYCFTIFYLPLQRDFGVSSAAIAMLYGAARLEGGFEGPLVGHLIDRLGPRTMILIGSSMAGIGLILISKVNHYWSFFFIYVFIVTLGGNAGFFHPVTTTMNHWFIEHRGKAFSCIMASMSVGGMLIAPLLSYIILQYGWRAGAIAAGTLILIVTIPSGLPIHRSPEDLGLFPDGAAPRATHSATSSFLSCPITPYDFTVKQALQTAAFWMLLMTLSLRLFVTVALHAHFIPLLAWQGTNEAAGAYLVSLSAGVSIVASLALGWMGDRWRKSLLCGLGVLPAALSLIWLTISQAAIAQYFFAIALALAMGTAPLNWALIGDFFGRARYATLRGIMGVGYGTATFISPIYAGWVFDRTGSYGIVLISFAGTLGVVISCFLFLTRPPIPRFREKI